MTTFLVDKGTITGIRVQWRFDEFYSSMLLDEFNPNHHKRFDSSDVARFRTRAFEATAKYGYFTHVRAGGSPVRIQSPQDFSASLEKGVVIYNFTLPFPSPVDPLRSVLTVTYYDETFYSDVAPAERDAVQFAGDGSLTCESSRARDPTITIYFGQVHPWTLTLHC